MAGFNNNQQQGFGGSPKALHQSSSSNSKAASGLAASKVIYKRRRASRRVPTTILETSCQEFRDAVQKLTGFHRPTPSAKQPKSRPGVHMPAYEDDAHHHHQQHLDYEDDAQVAPPGQSSSPQSVLSEPTSELPDSEFFHQFLRSANMESSTSPRGKHSDASVPSLRGARFPSFANMPPHQRAAYMNRPPVGASAGLFGPAGGRGPMSSFWDEGAMSEFMNSMAKLQDPTLAPNPYLIALENQLLLKFARRMQFAGGTSPLEHPWYQMADHMPPMRA